MLTLIAWVGLPPERFLVNRPPAEERLPMLDGGVIRADTTLLAELSGTVRPGGRTTIQRLARTARTHSRTLASLAHWSAA